MEGVDGEEGIVKLTYWFHGGRGGLRGGHCKADLLVPWWKGWMERRA